MRIHAFFVLLFLPVLSYAQQKSSSSEEIQRYLDNKQFAKAAYLLRQQINLVEHAELIEQLGDVYSWQQQWKSAAKCYKKLTVRYPDIANYHYKYGGALGMMALNNKFRAIHLIDNIKKAFKQAVYLDPKHAAAYRALVELYMQLPGILGGSRKKALQYAEVLEKLSKVEGCLAKGYIYEYDHQSEKANIHYAEALEYLDQLKGVSVNQLHYKIGELCSLHHKKLDKGLDHLQQYLRHATAMDTANLHRAYYTIAKIYRQKREKRKAMIWIDKALYENAGFKEALSEKNLIEAL